MTERSRRPVTLVLPLLVLALTGCDLGTGGPCVHTNEDPIIRVDEVTSSAGGNVESVELTAIQFQGSPTDPRGLVLDPAYGVELTEDGTLLCDVPCGFAFEAGVYEFVVRADGFEPEAVTMVAAYSVFRGGCPSSNSGSTVVTLELTPG